MKAEGSNINLTDPVCCWTPSLYALPAFHSQRLKNSYENGFLYAVPAIHSRRFKFRMKTDFQLKPLETKKIKHDCFNITRKGPCL